jgi:hypothetical protein
MQIKKKKLIQASVLVLLMEEIYEVHVSYGFMWHVILMSFMKTGTGVQATSRFRLSNLRGCNAGNTDKEGL